MAERDDALSAVAARRARDVVFDHLRLGELQALHAALEDGIVVSLAFDQQRAADAPQEARPRPTRLLVKEGENPESAGELWDRLVRRADLRLRFDISTDQSCFRVRSSGDRWQYGPDGYLIEWDCHCAELALDAVTDEELDGLPPGKARKLIRVRAREFHLKPLRTKKKRPPKAPEQPAVSAPPEPDPVPPELFEEAPTPQPPPPLEPLSETSTVPSLRARFRRPVGRTPKWYDEGERDWLRREF
jgi:hypothetical protein